MSPRVHRGTGSERAWNALARLEEAASPIPCLPLVVYGSARREAIARGRPPREHAPGVPAAEPAGEPAIAAILRGEAWLASGREGGFRGLLLDLHWELMQGLDPAPGRFRTGRAWLGSSDGARARRRFPPAGLIDRRLASIERSLQIEAEQDLLRAAAKAYGRLALLHPFPDGNGRVAQAWVAVFLRERGALSRPSLILGAALRASRKEYFAALDRLWSKDDRSWVRFFLLTLEKAALETASACRAIRERLESDERRLPPGGARRLLRRLGAGALPDSHLRDEERAALPLLLRARMIERVPGSFGEPIFFHSALAKVVAGAATGDVRVKMKHPRKLRRKS